MVGSLSPEDIRRIRSGALIESGIIVGDARTGASQAYKINSKLSENTKDLILSGDWDTMSDDEKALLLSQSQKITNKGYYAAGNAIPKQPKSKDEKEKEKAQNQAEFNKLLEEEYKLRLKIIELKTKMENSNDDGEKNALGKIINSQESKLNDIEKRRDKLSKSAGLRGKKGEAFRNEAEEL